MPVNTIIEKKVFDEVKKLNEDIKKLHQEIIAINQLGINFNNNSRGNGSTGAGTRSNTAELNALERERLRIANALAVSEARLTLANEQNTQSLARNRTELRTLNSAYLQLSQRQNEASRRVQDLIARGRTATQTQRQYNQELRNAQRDFDRLNQRVLQADRAVGRFNRNVGNYPTRALTSIRDLVGAFGIIGGVGLIASITKDVFEQTKQLNSLDSALKAVTETQSNFANQQEFINRITEQYGLSLLNTQKQFTSFYASARDKLGNNELQEIFENIAKSSAVLGLSVEQTEGAFRALEQMLSKGNVQAEEIRGQLGERLPGAFNVLAKSMGVTTQELNKLLKDGKVLADEVLPNFARAYAESVGADQVKRVETLVAAQNRLSTSWTNFIRTLTEGQGFLSKFFAFSIDGFSKILEGLELLITTENQRNKDLGLMLRNKYYDETLAYYEDLKATSEGTVEGIIARGRMATQTQKEYNEELKNAKNEFLETTKLDREYTVNRVKNLMSEIELLREKNKQNEISRKEIGFFGAGRIRQDIAMNEKIIEQVRKQLETEVGTLRAQNKVLEESAVLKKKDIELTKDQLKAIEDYNKSLYELNRTRLEIELFVLKQVVDDEDRYYSVRLEAQNKYRIKENELIASAYKEQLRLAKGNNILQQQALADYQLATLKALETNANKVEELQDLKLQPIGVKDLVDEEKQLAESAELATEELKKQNEQLIQNAKNQVALKNAIADYLKTFEEGFFQDAGLPTLFKVLNKEIMGFGENFAVTFTTIAEIAQEAYAFIEQTQQAQFDAQYARLEKERDIAIMFAGESASAREEIERQFDERRREIQRKQAEQQKINALFNIAINTAQAIVASLIRDPTGITAAIIGAIGAVQAGVVAAQQIPQFWRGTDNAPEGWATVDEKRPEVHTDSKGNIKSFGSEGGANLRYLNKGDKIYKSRGDYFQKELNGILKENGINISNKLNQFQSSKESAHTPTIGEIDQIVKRYVSKSNSQQQSQFKIKRTDIKQFLTDMVNETENKNNRYRGTGKSV